MACDFYTWTIKQEIIHYRTWLSVIVWLKQTVWSSGPQTFFPSPPFVLPENLCAPTTTIF